MGSFYVFQLMIYFMGCPQKIFYFLRVIVILGVVKSVTRKRTGDMRIQHGLVSCFFAPSFTFCVLDHVSHLLSFSSYLTTLFHYRDCPHLLILCTSWRRIRSFSQAFFRSSHFSFSHSIHGHSLYSLPRYVVGLYYRHIPYHSHILI